MRFSREPENPLPESDPFEFDCPRCLHAIKSVAGNPGESIECPECGETIEIPDPAAGGLFEDIFDELPSNYAEDPDALKVTSPQESESKDAGKKESEPEDDSFLIPESEEELGLKPDSTEDLLPLEDAPNQTTKNEEQTNAPIRIDGLDDLYQHDDVYGIKCSVCDTRIHVRPNQAGTFIECPVCYTKIKVEPPNPLDGPKSGKGGASNPGQVPDDGELKLSEPVERPTIDYNISESYGLAEPDEDLLAPRGSSSDEETHDSSDGDALDSGEDIPLVEFIDDPLPTSDEAGVAKKRPSKPADAGRKPLPKNKNKVQEGKKKSRKERYEEAQRRKAESESSTFFSPRTTDDEESDVEKEYPSFQEYGVGGIFAAALGMLRSRGVGWRVVVSFALLCLGAILMQWHFPDYEAAEADGGERDPGGFGAKLVSWLLWGVSGGIPYLLGLLMLWYTSSYIFRDAALGRSKVLTWKNTGFHELSGTVLLFTFGFFLAGLPSTFFSPLILPLRILVAPLLLLGSWFNQSPFQIIGIDAFGKANKEIGEWASFYSFLMILAFIGLGAGMLFWVRFMVPVFALNVVVTVLAVAIMAFTTLVFAAAAGWHCGRVVDGLSKAE